MTDAERLRAMAHDAWMALPPSPSYDIQTVKRDTEAACLAGAAALEAQAQPSELEELRLKLRIYENGTHVNQPLVDDIERWRREWEEAQAEEAERLREALTAVVAARSREDVSAAIEHARAALASPVGKERAMATRTTSWQPIATAPRDWTHILVATDAGEVCEAYWHGGVKEWLYANLDGDDEAATVEDVTHWMPLPTPPEAAR